MGGTGGEGLTSAFGGADAQDGEQNANIGEKYQEEISKEEITKAVVSAQDALKDHNKAEVDLTIDVLKDRKVALEVGLTIDDHKDQINQNLY